MPEILTESFCERCGTRYTFESTGTKRRPLGRVRTLSKGLRNFVLSDETSFGEAMLDARVAEEREASAHQLDAFHKTFNFCMSCRQYTCSNCWNEPEGRCLSCAPHLGTEILPAAFPDLDPHAGIAMPVAVEGSNGHLLEDEWPDVDLGSDRLAGTLAPEDAGVDLAFEVPPQPEPVEAVEPQHADGIAAELAEREAEPEPVEAAAAPEPVEAAAASAVDDAPPVDLLAERDLGGVPRITPRSAVGRTSAGRPETPATGDDLAAAAAAQTSALLAKFRPGQSLDEALDAYEAELAKARGDVDLDREELEEAEPAAVAAQEAEPEVSPAVEPAAAAQGATTPARDDIELPTWPTAPAATPALADRAAPPPQPAEPAAPSSPPVEPAPPAPPAPPAARPEPAPAAPSTPWALTAPVEPEGEPQWPAPPQWPMNRPAARADRAPAVPNLAGRPLVPDRSVDALWAASSNEVLARPAAPTAAVQPCVNCGLSLSANARFCRRCGTRQG